MTAEKSLEIESVESHYNNNYFNNSQKSIGEIGGRANLFKFQPYISPTDSVLDFGCGGGFLLHNMICGDKVGVEINATARQYCSANHKEIKVHGSLDDVPDGVFDVVISNHCLEHTARPLDNLMELRKKLKSGGKIIVCLPLDGYTYRWQDGNIQQHLYSFSPSNLGNLLSRAGFSKIETRAILHKWVPKYRWVVRLFGYKVLHVLSYLYGNFIYNTFPIRRKTKSNQSWGMGVNP